eukprot:TRINITY_DN1858_c0_g1_i1.p1 TRINITY_DN1858_c0_g1~~TRINITY_DN1858_c0_g1_i1.p1  ORF type:complete len:544 (-),score=60.95 TRINITY_DN1858_c0_g1_i1:56-1687(-)
MEKVLQDEAAGVGVGGAGKKPWDHPRYKSVPPPARKVKESLKMDAEEAMPWITLLTTYFAFVTNIILGHLREFLHKVILRHPTFRCEPGFAPLIFPKEYFYTRWMYGRIRDCWDRPICSVPAGQIEVMEREIRTGHPWFQDTTNTLTGRKMKAMNLGSYNYLGFAQRSGKCTDEVLESLERYGVGTTGTRTGAGNTDLHDQLDKTIAAFVGKEDAITFSMGYATNSTSIPGLIGKGGLIISDQLNHASIIMGCRSSGAKIKTFLHNDPQDLEKVLRQSIVEGQPRTHRPWKKILIVVEGIYSMEGEICPLPEIIAIKKKYKAYLYVDEAHSIGALGNHARGVCDYWDVDPSDVDILMGTFTKSFGAVGGYIASSREVISYLRQTSFGNLYSTSMSAPCAQMIISAFDVITGRDGTDDGARRIAALRDNSNYFRNRLREEGFRILGSPDSPIIPLLLYHPAKIALFSRECLKAQIAVVVVGFPATTLLASRARFCLSSDHTRESLEEAIQCISRIGDKLMLKYGDLPDVKQGQKAVKARTFGML